MLIYENESTQWPLVLSINVSMLGLIKKKFRDPEHTKHVTRQYNTERPTLDI